MNSGSSENDGKPNNFEDPNGVTYSLVITENYAGKTGVPQYTAVQNAKGELAANADNNYTIRNKNNANAFDDYTIYIVPGGRCIGDAVASSTKRHFAILYRLEGAGVYCIDDQ